MHEVNWHNKNKIGNQVDSPCFLSKQLYSLLCVKFAPFAWISTSGWVANVGYSLSAFPFTCIFRGYYHFINICGCFSTQSFCFLVGLLAYFSNHNLFYIENIFVSFNEYPSLVCWCTVIHRHQPQGPSQLSFSRVR